MVQLKRRFGVRHPLPFFKNAGVFTKTFATESAATKADDLAKQVFTPLAGLAGLFIPDASLPTPTSASFKGFTVFYEVA